MFVVPNIGIGSLQNAKVQPVSFFWVLLSVCFVVEDKRLGSVTAASTAATLAACPALRLSWRTSIMIVFAMIAARVAAESNVNKMRHNSLTVDFLIPEHRNFPNAKNNIYYKKHPPRKPAF